jgi:integrase
MPPTTPYQEDNIMQGKRTRARDSRGRPIPGLYVRDGRYIAGFQCPQTDKWRMQTLVANTITDARRERDGLLAGLRESRVAAPDKATFYTVFVEYQSARSLSERTTKHERHLVDRHLATIKNRRVQEITAGEIARLLGGMKPTYSEWTRVAVYRLLRGSFALAVKRGVVTRSPMDGLAASERPKQRNKKRVRVLDNTTMAKLIKAAGSERWTAALALAGYAGLRLGEIRALTWADVDLKAGTIAVRRSLLPDGTPKPPKTEAGERDVPILPALRRALVRWRVRSPHTNPGDLIICTADRAPVQERNIRRALEDAKTAAGLDAGDERLSMHSLRHSWASMLATDLQLPATTLAKLTGHADAGFTLKVYARDSRETTTVVEDVLTRAAGARIGT